MRWLSVLVIAFSSAACGEQSYSAKAISASVVDSATAQPLAGVVIVALWQLQGGAEAGRTGVLEILETKTDSSGRFAFPAWGPISRQGLKGRLLCFDPQLMIFRDGYKPEVLSNRYDVVDCLSKDNPVRYSEWSGKILKLSKLDDVQLRDSFATFVTHIEFTLDTDGNTGDCYWKEAPQMLAAVHLASARLAATSPGARAKPYFTLDDIRNTPQCGDPRKIVGEYLP